MYMYIKMYMYVASFILHIINVGDVDSLDLCEDSNLGEESPSDMQFTDASSSDAN